MDERPSGPDLSPRFRGESGGQVAFPRGAADGHDQLALVFRAFGSFHGRPYVGAGADARKDALLLCKAPGHCKRVVIGYPDALGDLGRTLGVFEMQVVGHKTGTGSLNLVGPGFDGFAREGLGDDWGVVGLDGDGAKLRAPR